MYLRFGVASLSLSLSSFLLPPSLSRVFHCIENAARGALSAHGVQNSSESRETIGAPDAADPLARAAASWVNTYAFQRGYELLTRIAKGLLLARPKQCATTPPRSIVFPEHRQRGSRGSNASPV